MAVGLITALRAVRPVVDAYEKGATLVCPEGLVRARVPWRPCRMDVVGRSDSDRCIGDDIDRAIQIVREKARRVPVVDSGNEPVGILSLGDLALERDPRSVLGQISAAPPNQ